MGRSKRIQWVAAPAALSVVAALAGRAREVHAAAITLDTFNDPAQHAMWQFSNGAEFPGASGALRFDENQGDPHLRLSYDFTGGGVYVAATRELTSPVDVNFLRAKMMFPGVAQLAVRVRDTSGQWLQFSVSRALAPAGVNEWQRVAIALHSPTAFWDGAADGVIHQPITTLSFVVDSEGIGEVRLDQVEGLDSLDIALDPALVALASVPSHAVDLKAGFGVAVHDLSDNASLDAAKRAGFTWARTDLFWHWVETTAGEYNFAPFDSFLARLDEREMRALFILDYGNELHAGGPPITAAAQQAFVNFAVAAAERYATRNVAFEVWNEPDTDQFWPPASDPIAFAQLASVTAQAIRTVAPDVQVVTGGLSWFDFEYLSAMLAAGGGTYVDAIGIHPYRGTSSPESVGAHVARAVELMDQQLMAPLALWDTEWGYSATQFGSGHSEQARSRQAIFAVRRMLSARLAGLPLATWYDLKDDGSDPTNAEHNFGLLTETGDPKPAMQALETLSRATTDRTLIGVIDVAQPLLCGIKLTSLTDTLLILWSTDSSSPVNLSVPEPSGAWDVLGNTLPTAALYPITEMSGPLYLRYAVGGAEPGSDAGFEETRTADAGMVGDGVSGADQTAADVSAEMPTSSGEFATGSPLDAGAAPGNLEAGRQSIDLDASPVGLSDSGERTWLERDVLPRVDRQCACSVPGAPTIPFVPPLLAIGTALLMMTRRRSSLGCQERTTASCAAAAGAEESE